MNMITAPNWCKDATPTPRGWVKGKELLKAQKLSESDIAEWNNVMNPTPKFLSESPSHKPVSEMNVQEVTELVKHFSDDEGMGFDKDTKVEKPKGGKKTLVEKMKGLLSE
jgi:hypothetical protein